MCLGVIAIECLLMRMSVKVKQSYLISQNIAYSVKERNPILSVFGALHYKEC